MASWAPAAAGTLFYGLSLGVGLATLVALWARACGATAEAADTLASRLERNRATALRTSVRLLRAASPWFRRLAPWAALALPAWELAGGDAVLAGTLALLTVGALWLQGFGAVSPTRALALRASLLVWFLAALVPWATAPEGPFTRLRDQWLLPTPVGSLVNDFYYRWTLYPAEALKPLAARSQPTVQVTPEVPRPLRDAFCAQAREIGPLCVDTPEAADLAAVPEGEGPALALGAARIPWPRARASQRGAWRDFSEATDSRSALRHATRTALFFGCPLALCWAFSSLAASAGGLFGLGRRGLLAAHVVAALLAASLFSAGLAEPSLEAERAALTDPSPDPAAIRRYAASDDPVARFYAVRAAGRAGREQQDLLVDALSDPVINVRYAAAEALGLTGGDRAVEALREVLGSPEAWYVKERAYSGLWRLGWRQE